MRQCKLFKNTENVAEEMNRFIKNGRTDVGPDCVKSVEDIFILNPNVVGLFYDDGVTDK